MAEEITLLSLLEQLRSKLKTRPLPPRFAVKPFVGNQLGWMRLISLGPSVVIATLLLGIMSPQILSEYHLSRCAVTTMGTIVSVEPEIHNGAEYRFTYSGNSYEGGGSNDDNLTVGKPVKVYLDPKNPADSTMNEPGYAMENDLVSVLTMLLALSFVAFIMWRKYKPKA